MPKNAYEEARDNGYLRFTDPPWATELKPEGASKVYLVDRVTGRGHWLTEIVTDTGDGITDADFEGPGFTN